LYAIAFCALMGILALARGTVAYPEYGMTTWGIMGTYVVLGFASGVTIGLLRPALRWTWGVMFVGWLAAAILYSGAGIAMEGWSVSQLKDGAMIGVVFGPIGALLLRKQFRDFDQRPNGR
jgi:hypothetical protein